MKSTTILMAFVILLFGCEADIARIDYLHASEYNTLILEKDSTHARVVFVSPKEADTVWVSINRGAYRNGMDGLMIPNYGSTCICRPRIAAKTYFRCKK